MNVNQLIQELDEEAKSADGAALVIALKERTSFVYANDPEREKQLTSELDAGGLPVAIMRWDPPVNGQFVFKQRILADYLGHQLGQELSGSGCRDLAKGSAFLTDRKRLNAAGRRDGALSPF
jgi:hypothetical protein